MVARRALKYVQVAREDLSAGRYELVSHALENLYTYLDLIAAAEERARTVVKAL